MKIDGHGVIPLPNTTIMRTILASEFITDELLNRLSVVDDITEKARPNEYSTVRRWLLEFRTFSFLLPRQTHKTSTLLKNITPGTVMIVHNENMRRHILRDNPLCKDYIFTPSSFVAHVPTLLSNQDDGPPISRIFMDDLEFATDRQMNEIYDAIIPLYKYRRLTHDVFILKVGTPVR